MEHYERRWEGEVGRVDRGFTTRSGESLACARGTSMGVDGGEKVGEVRRRGEMPAESCKVSIISGGGGGRSDALDVYLVE